MDFSIHDYLKADRGNNGPRMDFWYPKTSGSYELRLYRVGGKLFSTAQVHEVTPYAPGRRREVVPCTMQDDCPICDQVKKLKAAGDPGSLEMAKQLRARIEGDLAVVLVSEPNKYRMWCDHSWSRIRDFIQLVAQEGEWFAPAPDGSKPELVTEYEAAVNRGLDRVCGPKGVDLVVMYSKGQKPAYKFVFKKNPGAELPLAEADTPNPSEIKARVKAAQAAKMGG